MKNKATYRISLLRKYFSDIERLFSDIAAYLIERADSLSLFDIEYKTFVTAFLR